MAIATLVTWLVTAVLGFVMLGTWASRGGLRGGETRFPVGLVVGHFLLAASGLVVWIVYLVTKTHVLTWVAVALLVLVAVLGDVLFLRWWRGPAGTAESRLPKPVVYTHGVFAVATVVLALVVALS